jgi:RHS repeat-associated protein
MSQPQLASDNMWRQSIDAVRGRVRWHVGMFGLPDQVELADGTRLHIDRDATGGIRSLESASLSLAIHTDVNQAHISIVDRAGTTEVLRDDGRLQLQREQFSVSLDFDETGRLRRAAVPGLPAALVYSRRSDDTGSIGLEGAAPMIEVSPARGGIRFESSLGGWQESHRIGSSTLSAWTAGNRPLSVDIDQDVLGRVHARSWSDGLVEAFERDGDGRLVRWMSSAARTECREYRYEGEHLAAEVRDNQTWTRDLDGAGRVLRLRRADGSSVVFRYDACGRRVARTEGSRVTRYAYDALGQLVAIDDSTHGRVQFQFDGLGRRVARDGLREHRDASGRLWSVTDAGGRLLHAYVWFNDRVTARLELRSGAALAELYATDPFGTPLMSVGSQGVDRCPTNPYGSIESSARPTLYGHFGDPSSGLVHFGGREYDPELGLFLTPDPWDGGDADPRRWAGLSDRWLRLTAEIPRTAAHPYALCGFDPVGRADRDGHLSFLGALTSLMLIPTWAWPLTAISLFFFLPLDLLYGELIRGLVLLFSGDARPFGPYTISNSIWATGSSRQNMLALGLNGILPGLVTSRGDLYRQRAVTIGNVVWIDRNDLSLMERPSVLELGSLTGWNTDPGKESVLHVLGTGSHGKRFHAAYWTRGYGNTMSVTSGTPDMLAFDDVAVDVHKPDGSTRHTGLAPALLARQFPRAFPLDHPEALESREYLFDRSAAGAKVGQLELITTAWFALQMNGHSGLAAGDFIEITGPHLDALHRQVVMTIPDPDHDIVIVAQDLPPAYKGVSLKLARVIADPTGQDIANWAQDGAATKLKASVTPPLAPYPKLVNSRLVRITDAAGTPPTPPPGAPAPTGGAVAFAGVKQATVTVKLSTPLAPAVAATVVALHSVEQADVGHANLPDATKPGELKWVGSRGGISAQDLVSVTAGTVTTFARVTNSTNTDVTLQYVAAPLTSASEGDVQLRRLNDRTGSDDKLTVVIGGVDDIELKFGSTALQPGNIVHFVDGNVHQVRALQSWTQLHLELSEPAPGSGPYTLHVGRTDPGFSTRSGVRLSELKRFLKSTGGIAPADFGVYPNALHRLWPASLAGSGALPYAAAFVAHVVGNAPFDAAFRASWTHVTVGADQYVVLDHDLPIKILSDSHGVTYRWHIDQESPDPEDDVFIKQDPAGTAIGPVNIQIHEFTAGTSKQNFGVSAARVCVPLQPGETDTEADALRQHELHHAVQAKHWGPLMTGLPIPGIQSLVVDIAGAKNAPDVPGWLRDDSLPGQLKEFQGAQFASIGYLLELAWAYLLTFNQFKDLHFSDWNKLLNPFSSALINLIGKSENEDLDPNQPLSRSFGLALAQILATATDLRSWIPFIGFVPGMLPDGAKSFLEQQASRASGDLYSTVLSVDDKFHTVVESKVVDIIPDTDAANIVKPLGELARVMIFPEFRRDRVFQQALANAPGSPLRYATTYINFDLFDLVGIGPQSAVLVHTGLYEPLPATPPTRTPHSIDGPRSNPTAVVFLEAQAGDRFKPRLRALTPLPPAVVRTAGFYFIPSSPAKYDCIAYYGSGEVLPNGSPNPDFRQALDAKTQSATLTFTDGAVTFGEDPLPYVTPPIAGSVPAALPAALKRFVTESVSVNFGTQLTSTDRWELNLCTTDPGSPPPPLPAARSIGITPQTHGWTLQLGKSAGDVRVRVFRTFHKNDAANDANNDQAFDLAYPADKFPSLKNVRSYLDKDIWIPVRDFLFTIEDLPELAPAGTTVTIDSETVHKLDLAVRLTGAARPNVTAKWNRTTPRPVPDEAIPVPVPERTQDHSTHPRGEVWQLRPLGGVLEEDSTYKVTVTFGDPANSVIRALDLKVTPFIRLTGAGEHAFEASAASPCTLSIVGGAAPYTLTNSGLPAGTQAVVNASQVVVSVTTAPPSDRRVVLTVTDPNGKTGRRTITVKK